MATVASILRTDFKTVDKRDGLHTVLGWVTGDSDKLPIVLDGDRPFGIVNERALMSRRLDPNAHVEGYAMTTRALPITASIEDARARMQELRAPCVPVEDARGKIAGYVTAIDIARALDVQRTARELALPVAMLEEKQTLGDALHHFTQEHVDFLPVTNGGGKVTGVLPRRTVLRMELQSGHSRGRKDAGGEKVRVLEDTVGGFMEDAPVRLPAATSYATLLDTLEDNGYAIVEDANGKPLGLVTPTGLLRVAAPK